MSMAQPERSVQAGEAVAVFPTFWPLAAAEAGVDFCREQVAEQCRAILGSDRTEVVLEPGPAASLPGRKEPVAGPINPVEHVQR